MKNINIKSRKTPKTKVENTYKAQAYNSQKFNQLQRQDRKGA